MATIDLASIPEPTSLGTVQSAVFAGVEATLVTVEVYRSDGVPHENIVGLAGAAVRESLERIRSACKQNGLDLKPRRTTVNLAPADHPKGGSGLDLPIALGILASEGHVDTRRLQRCICLGELGLDGSIRSVAGALPAALAARRAKLCRLMVPRANAGEAAAVPDIEVIAVGSLKDAVAYTEGELAVTPVEVPPPPEAGRHVDLGDIVGQAGARRALEIAAAGGHHLLMVGIPGCGKTLLARAMPGVLPELTFEEALEASAVYSVVGQLAGRGLLRERPFRAPHHSVTVAGLIGGGVPPRPGEVSLALHGVLFLDELPEFRRNVLEALRQPLEEAQLQLVRGGRSVSMPARFQLIGAMNPCPCGRGEDDAGCRCGEGQVRAYWRRLSGPLLDRIDLVVGVARAPLDRLIEGSSRPESSAAVRERVSRARALQAERLHRYVPANVTSASSVASLTNASIPTRELAEICSLSPGLRRTAARDAEAFGLSARGWHRVLRVARTIADLDGAERIAPHHLNEAFQYRTDLHDASMRGVGA